MKAKKPWHCHKEVFRGLKLEIMRMSNETLKAVRLKHLQAHRLRIIIRTRNEVRNDKTRDSIMITILSVSHVVSFFIHPAVSAREV